MQDTISRYINTGAFSERQATYLKAVLNPIADRLSCQAHNSAALEITAGGGTTAQIGSGVTFQYVVQGISRTIAAGTDMPALPSGTITAGSFNIFAFFADSAGTVSALAGTEGTTRALAKFPAFPEGKTLIGYLVVTYASTFTNGTTPLDTATTLYISPIGPFDPSILL